MQVKNLLYGELARLLHFSLMKTAIGIVLIVSVVAMVSCRKVDVRTAAITVPGMKTRACAERIIAALGNEQHIAPDRIDVQLDTRTIRVRYDSIRHSVKNLEYTVAKAGFDANDIPADAAAREALPPECR